MSTQNSALDIAAQDFSELGSSSAMSRISTQHIFALCVIVTAISCCGCSGWAELSLVSTDQNRIAKRGPLVFEMDAPECYYWVDGERINIALAYENLSLIGEYGKKNLVASIVLDGLPAHRSRDYRLDRNSIRGRFRHGAKHLRFASLSGILALWLEGDNVITGRLRASAKQQDFNALLGWTGNQQVLLLGEFRAVRDRKRSLELVRRSEADGLERELQRTTQGKPRGVVGPEVRPLKADHEDGEIE